MPKCDNQTSARFFSCKFAAYFQNTFFSEHFWIAASGISTSIVEYHCLLLQVLLEITNLKIF